MRWGEQGWALLPLLPARLPARLPGRTASPLAAGCPLLCPQPCRSPSMPTPARSSGLSTKAIAIGTSPSTKPGLKLTSIAPSSPLASDQPSWPPSTGDEHRNLSSHPSMAWGRRKMGMKSHSHSTTSVSAAGSCPSLSIPLHQPEHPSGAATGSSLMHWAQKGNIKNAFSWAGRKTDVVFPKFPQTTFFTLGKGVEIQHDYMGFPSHSLSPSSRPHYTPLAQTQQSNQQQLEEGDPFGHAVG